MAAGGRKKARAEKRIAYTGENHELAAESTPRRGDYRLPSAHGVQAHLETQILLNLGTSGSWWAHPTGIASVTPGRGIAVVRLDKRTLINGKSYDLAEHVLANLLPYAETGAIQVNGVLGLRVSSIKGRELRVGLAEGGATIALRSTAKTDWVGLIEQRRFEIEGTEFTPLWQQSGITDYERETRARYPSVYTAEEQIAWLGSGLLRRINLFASASSAYSTRWWMTGDNLIFELDRVPEISADHDVFLGELTHQIWGIALRVADRHCDCASAAAQHRDSYQCTYLLAHRGGLPGLMQIRFRTVEPYNRADLRQQLRDTGATPRWLARVLPRARTAGSRASRVRGEQGRA